MQAGLLGAYDAAYTVGVATALLLAAALCLLAAGLVWLALDARPAAPAPDAADEALAELI